MRYVKFVLFLLLMNGVRSDVLKHYAKQKNTVKLMEATTEPLNNVSPYEKVHYTVANLSYDFKSSVKFHPRGMAHLYMITDKFIKFIEKEQAFPEGKVLEEA